MLRARRIDRPPPSIDCIDFPAHPLERVRSVWCPLFGSAISDPTLVFFAPERNEVFRTEGYFKTFHVHGALDYVATGAYRWQPNFQRYLAARREALALALREFATDLMA